MPIVDSIPVWLSASSSAANDAAKADPAAADESEPFKLSQTQSVEPGLAGETEGAPAFGGPALRAGSSPPISAFPDLDPLSDTLLAKIAAGTECLASIASYHRIPYPRFTLWLLEPSTQERFAALSTAIASAARLTATAALPDIVRGLKTTVDQLQSQTHMTIAPAGGPGANHLLAESVILRRHRALIAAASLIYRTSRFTCPAPADPRTDVPPRSALGSRCSARQREHPAAQPPRGTLARLPKLDLLAIDFADPDPRPTRESAPRHRDQASEGDLGASPIELAPEAGTPQPSPNPDPERGGRNPILDFTSDFPHPTSDIVGGPGEPTISVDDALHMLTAEYDLSDEEVAELRDDSHSWIRDFIPPSAATTSATLSARPTADDGWSASELLPREGEVAAQRPEGATCLSYFASPRSTLSATARFPRAAHSSEHETRTPESGTRFRVLLFRDLLSSASNLLFAI